MPGRPLRAAALALALWAGLAGAASAAEEILEYDIEVEVLGDGVLDVTETIRVRAEGDDIRHGIYRDVPLAFEDAGGITRQATFEIVEIVRDGESEPYHTAHSSDGIRIYVGDAEVLVEPGVYIYRIRYLTGRQLRFLDNHTEIFWNMTGNEWVFPINEIRARVSLPGDAPPRRWTAYTGQYGERGQDFAGEVLPDGTLEVRTTRVLGPGEGLSVVAEIPSGLVVPPSGGQQLEYWYLDNRRFIFGGIGLIAVLVFYLTAWSAVGRDPPKGTIIPLFHPPDGISPALASYVSNYGWSGGWREFTAAALSLAVKGLIVFDDSGEDIVLTRTGGAASGALATGEGEILKWIDRRGGSVAIDKANGTSLASALKTFRTRVEKENRNRFFRRNLGHLIIGVVMTVAALAVTAIFGGLDEGEIGLLFVIGFFGMMFGLVIVPVIRRVLHGKGVRRIFAAAISVFVLIWFGGFAFAFLGPMLASLPDHVSEVPTGEVIRRGFPFFVVAGLAAMNGLFFYLLRAPTAAGRRIMDQIEGLELYIRTAETGRLNIADIPDLTPERFERLLPYAVALEAEKPWSEAFAAAFTRAHPGEALETAYRPGWHGGHGWAGGDFGRSISSVVSTAQSSFQSSVPAPSSGSSGFSGGGGSGGGGGGGGGGGW